MSMHKTKVGASKMGTVKTGGNPRDGIAQNGLTVSCKRQAKAMMAGGMAKMMAGGGKAKMMAGGGKAKMMASGGMPMVMKDGKKVPAFAADGKGKMAAGGRAKMMAGGGMSKMMKSGGRV
jgi:hypothetical protein